VEKIDLDARMHKKIDGMYMNLENQDGIDLRNGCHHIIISDITGSTGDDVIALTAIATEKYRPGGTVKNTHVMHNDWTKRERDSHDIVIRNVVAHSYLCYTVRLLPAWSRIYNIVIDGIIDTAPNCEASAGTLLLGCGDGGYGTNLPDSMRNVTISNVICNSRDAVIVSGYLTDSVISNVINRNPNCPVLFLERENGLRNVMTSNLITATV
jgi:polygalacturonase